MGRRLSALMISAIVTSVFQIASLDPWQVALAETLDDEGPTHAEVATAAGAAAGIVEWCGVDVAPIGSAFKAFLAGAKLDSPSQQSLLQQYKTAEASALSTLAIDNSGSCAGATSIMRETVHSLTKPAS
jgi:hypothetical protein